MDQEIEETGYNQLNKNWRDGYVYVLDYGDGETFKVGHTTGEVEQRIKQISKGNVILPMRPVMSLLTSTNCYYLENIIQMRLDDQHIRGEWFKLSFVELVELYQILKFFGGVDLHERWYDLVPKDYEEYINYCAISPNYPIFTKREHQELNSFDFSKVSVDEDGGINYNGK